MAVDTKPPAEPRLPLSRERVLRTAIELADTGGIDALSMRRLGQELGVEAMSLYHHVANKDDLLDGMVDIVVGEFTLATADGDWRGSIRASAVSAHDVLVRHPWAASLMLQGDRARPARFRSMDAILGCLRAAGFSAEMTHHAYHALDSHVMGFTLWQVGISAGMASLPGSVAGFLETLDVERYPHLAEHIEQHLSPASDDEVSEFEFGLGLILDGLERIRVEGTTPPRK